MEEGDAVKVTRTIIIKNYRTNFALASSLLIGALVAAVAWAATPETKRKIEEIRAAAARLKSFHIEIVPPPPEAVAKSGATGSIIWAAPHFYRVESLEPVPGVGKIRHVSVCDGQTSWSYYPTERSAYKIDVGSLIKKFGEQALYEHGVLLNFDPFQGANDEDAKFLNETKIEGALCYGFEFPFASKQSRLLSPERIVLWVGVADGLLRRREVRTKEGQLMDTIRWRVLSVGADTSPEMFQLKLPPEVVVEDLTAEVEAKVAKSAKTGAP